MGIGSWLDAPKMTLVPLYAGEFAQVSLATNGKASRLPKRVERFDFVRLPADTVPEYSLFTVDDVFGRMASTCLAGSRIFGVPPPFVLANRDTEVLLATELEPRKSSSTLRCLKLLFA